MHDCHESKLSYQIDELLKHSHTGILAQENSTNPGARQLRTIFPQERALDKMEKILPDELLAGWE